MKQVPEKHSDGTVGCFQVYHLFSLEDLKPIYWDAEMWGNLLQSAFCIVEKISAVESEHRLAQSILGDLSKVLSGDLTRHNKLRRKTTRSKTGKQVFGGLNK